MFPAVFSSVAMWERRESTVVFPLVLRLATDFPLAASPHTVSSVRLASAAMVPSDPCWVCNHVNALVAATVWGVKAETEKGVAPARSAAATDAIINRFM